MPAEPRTVGFCATYFAIFRVQSSDGSKTYDVDLAGTEGHCECEGFKYRQKCKHMTKVWAEACLWNPQWHDGGPGTLRPDEFTNEDRHFGECPRCGGPLVPVRIMV